MKIKSLYLGLLIIALAFLLQGCGKNMPDDREIKIDPEFTLKDTWFFQTVAANGVIGGVDQVDDDPNPSGFITFEPDGTGYAEFSINLLNQSYGKTEVITWERSSDTEVIITESDGDMDTWALIRANDNIIEADWEVYFSPENNAVFTAVLTPTP